MELAPIVVLSAFPLLSALFSQKPEPRDFPIEIVEITIYPVKSCQGIQLTKAKVGLNGFKYDRNWMVIDQKNRFVSQREKPTMCFIETGILEDEGVLVLRAPDMPEIRVPLKTPEIDANDAIRVQVWDDTMTAVDLGDEVATWFSKYLDGEFRFVAKGTSVRKLDASVMPRGEEFDFEPQTGFTDGFPFLLISNESLDDLNGRLDQAAYMKNFRPNIVVKGCTAFEEESWRKIRLSNRIFHVVSLCPRCPVVTVDTDDATFSLKTLKTLQRYRKVHPDKNKNACFGVNLAHTELGFDIKVGDTIDVLSTGKVLEHEEASKGTK